MAPVFLTDSQTFFFNRADIKILRPLFTEATASGVQGLTTWVQAQMISIEQIVNSTQC